MTPLPAAASTILQAAPGMAEGERRRQGSSTAQFAAPALQRGRAHEGGGAAAQRSNSATGAMKLLALRWPPPPKCCEMGVVSASPSERRLTLIWLASPIAGCAFQVQDSSGSGSR